MHSRSMSFQLFNGNSLSLTHSDLIISSDFFLFLIYFILHLINAARGNFIFYFTLNGIIFIRE